MRYRPLATAIVGERRVHVSTNVASRQALRRVGKRAATTGDTIHLAAPAPPVAVLAHELTHVAHPSPEPRFFADDRQGPEERRADEVARIMTRAAILPRSTAAGGGSILRRQRATGRAGETVSAAALAASITADAGADTIRRVRIGGHRGRGGTTIPTAPPTTQVGNVPTGATTTAGTVPQPPPATEAKQAAAAAGLLGQFDRILELLEERILTELERRGGRYRGGF